MSYKFPVWGWYVRWPGSLLLSYLPVLPLLVVVRLITEVGSRGRARACGRSWIRGEIGTDQIVFLFCLFDLDLDLDLDLGDHSGRHSPYLLSKSEIWTEIAIDTKTGCRYRDPKNRNIHLHPHLHP